MIRRGPRPDRYVIIANEIARDYRLSFRARGLLTYLLSMPEGWRTNSNQLAAQSPREGRDAIRTALKELETVGYLTRCRIQDLAGRWHTETIVTDRPVENHVDKPAELSTAEDGLAGAGSSVPIRTTYK